VKRLLLALNENVMRYEAEFGQIKLPNRDGNAIKMDAFDPSKGDA
jgi:hypothetical protein